MCIYSVNLKATTLFRKIPYFYNCVVITDFRMIISFVLLAGVETTSFDTSHGEMECVSVVVAAGATAAGARTGGPALVVIVVSSLRVSSCE